MTATRDKLAFGTRQDDPPAPHPYFCALRRQPNVYGGGATEGEGPRAPTALPRR